MPVANQRVGEYVLVDRIGQGAFGEVWRARHHAWADQVVAIKIPSDPQYVRNLQREGIAVHRLSHANIVKAIAFDPFADPPYLAMEYVPGISLRQLIERGPMQVSHAVAVIKQVLAALDHAHKSGLVHRDVKPENILLHQRARKGLVAGTVKLTDFGLGRAAQDASSIVFSREQHEAKQIVGSAPYMAPEQMEGAEVDARADLYACGVVLFEMLTGKRPAGVEVPSEINPLVPQSLDEVFRRAFARKERRFASAEEFFRAVQEASTASPPAEPFLMQHRNLLMAGGIVAAVLVVAWIWMGGKSTRDHSRPADRPQASAVRPSTEPAEPDGMPAEGTTNVRIPPDRQIVETGRARNEGAGTANPPLENPTTSRVENRPAVADTTPGWPQTRAAPAVVNPTTLPAPAVLAQNKIEVLPAKSPPPDAGRVAVVRRAFPKATLELSPGELFNRAGETDDPVARTALLQMTVEKACAEGLMNLAFGAIDRMAQRHDVDVLALKADAIAAMPVRSANARIHGSNSLELTKLAVEEKRYGLAERIAASSLRFARASEDTDLVRRATLQVLEIQKLKSQ